MTVRKLGVYTLMVVAWAVNLILIALLSFGVPIITLIGGFITLPMSAAAERLMEEKS